MMRNCGKQRDRDGDILLVRNIDACIHVYTIHVRYRYLPFIVQLYRRIRFEDQLDHKDESRSREVGISGPSLPTLPWYKLPSGAVASVCGS